jgi:putative toxin-antitoxin system antitoxin component (TIGR02293 family)
MLTQYDAAAVAAALGMSFPLASAAPSSATSLPPGLAESQEPFARAPGVSAQGIERAVERGLPRSALRHVAELLAGGDPAKASALEWGVVPKTTLERRKTHLTAPESERTERMARLFVHARRALGTETEARAFMTEPHPRLDGRSPVEASRTDLGTRRTEQLLNALEYGLAL